MYLKIEMNEKEEIDLEFKGTDKQAVLMLLTAMDGSGDLYKLFKQAVDLHEQISE